MVIMAAIFFKSNADVNRCKIERVEQYNAGRSGVAFPGRDGAVRPQHEHEQLCLDRGWCHMDKGKGGELDLERQ
jgi:hypothetical protein